MLENQQKITLSVTQQEFNIIIGSLHEIPFKVADPLIKNFIKQAKDQLMNKEESQQQGETI